MLSDYLKALMLAPGSDPPLPAGLDRDQLVKNGWIEKQGDGWKATHDALLAASIKPEK